MHLAKKSNWAAQSLNWHFHVRHPNFLVEVATEIGFQANCVHFYKIVALMKDCFDCSDCCCSGATILSCFSFSAVGLPKDWNGPSIHWRDLGYFTGIRALFELCTCFSFAVGAFGEALSRVDSFLNRQETANKIVMKRIHKRELTKNNRIKRFWTYFLNEQESFVSMFELTCWRNDEALS